MKVVFVCLGNICRSPMAELIFKHLLKERGLSGKIEVDSFATSAYEVGNHVYPPALRALREHGIEGNHVAKRLTLSDIASSDYVLVMDESNYLDAVRIATEKYRGRVYKLCSFTSNPRDVADPWYTRDFERAFKDIEEGCTAFLDYLTKQKER